MVVWMTGWMFNHPANGRRLGRSAMDHRMNRPMDGVGVLRVDVGMDGWVSLDLDDLLDHDSDEESDESSEAIELWWPLYGQE